MKYRSKKHDWQYETLDGCVVCHSPMLKQHFSGNFSGGKIYPGLSDNMDGMPMSFFRCEHCTAIFQNPRPSLETMTHIFNDPVLFGGREGNKSFNVTCGYYDYSAYENALSRNSRSLLRKMSYFLPPPADLLEIGGATGWFMNAAKKFGYRVQGLDISSTLATRVKEKYGIHVAASPVEKAELPSDSFDIICSFGGIECWMDARKGISNVHRMLRKNGIFFFNYINCNTILGRLTGKRYFQYHPYNNNLFNQRTIHYLLRSNGLQVISERMPITHISLGPLFHYLQMKTLFRLSSWLKIDKLVFVLPNIQARTIIALKT